MIFARIMPTERLKECRRRAVIIYLYNLSSYSKSKRSIYVYLIFKSGFLLIMADNRMLTHLSPKILKRKWVLGQGI